MGRKKDSKTEMGRCIATSFDEWVAIFEHFDEEEEVDLGRRLVVEEEAKANIEKERS